MIDSKIYGNAWGTDEMRAMFDEIPCIKAWLKIISSLAEAQADVGLIPTAVAEEIHIQLIHIANPSNFRYSFRWNKTHFCLCLSERTDNI